MTVDAEIDSTTSRATSSSASRRKVQRAWPDGGSLQAICTSRASFSPSRIGCVGGRARLALQRSLQALLDKALADVEHRSRRAGKRLRCPGIAPVRAIGIDLQEHVGMLDLVGGGLALADQIRKPGTLVVGETHDVLLVHKGIS